ncbi:glycosyltransferase [Alkalibacillus haloalkaliphilus]|uniref:glycosyltransferase n=1 Tax=Alkalibacillus haloalkaliphilus TaxID=94136 RepID=UPI002936BFDB|nr:glycosyltransferase [Alkalibacillus haloalkaliphilus]MDV2583309.1 glycosyltransferase [Alkalibacillus haloalkaliphilus]
MKRKKILFFIYTMGKGGAARTLLNVMNNLDRNKFEPMLVTLNHDGEYEQYVQDDVQFIKLEAKRLRSGILPLAKIIRKEKVDIVFSTIPNYNMIAILAKMLSFTRAKVVVREADHVGGSFLGNLKCFVYGRFYNRTDQVISLSEGVKQNLVEKYKLKPNAIEVVYNPLDIENIKHQIEIGELPKDVAPIFNQNEKVIVTAGRLVKQKDHDTLIKAFAKTNEQVKTQLVILGEGPLEEELKSLAQKLNVEDRVHFIGFQDNPYIFFHEADLFVLTSIHEGFSHVIAEALASGTPVVSTNCKSGPSEVLANGEYGDLCPVGDSNSISEAMTETLTLPPEALQVRVSKGEERAEFFNANKIVSRYGQVILNTFNK